MSEDVPYGPMVMIFHEIARERKDQIEMGYTPEHDDDEYGGRLAVAAACYASPPDSNEREAIVNYWPWEASSWKPNNTNRRNELIKAAALIVAEIERLDRIAAKKA